MICCSSTSINQHSFLLGLHDFSNREFKHIFACPYRQWSKPILLTIWQPCRHATCNNHGSHSEIVTLLLDRGANIDQKACCGTTSMQDAASAGHFHIVEMLLDRGASTSMRSNQVSSKIFSQPREPVFIKYSPLTWFVRQLFA